MQVYNKTGSNSWIQQFSEAYLNLDCQSIPGWLKAIIQSIYHPGAASVISLKNISYLLLNQVFKVVVSTPSQDLSNGGVTLITF